MLKYKSDKKIFNKYFRYLRDFGKTLNSCDDDSFVIRGCYDNFFELIKIQEDFENEDCIILDKSCIENLEVLNKVEFPKTYIKEGVSRHKMYREKIKYFVHKNTKTLIKIKTPKGNRIKISTCFFLDIRLVRKSHIEKIILTKTTPYILGSCVNIDRDNQRRFRIFKLLEAYNAQEKFSGLTV